MRTFALVSILVCAQSFCGQLDDVVLRGLSVYGGGDEKNFPILLRSKFDADGKPLRNHGRITIQFDILAPHPPNVKIRFFHCNRDWKIDDNLFVNDVNHNTSFLLNFITAPGGVREYRYRYVNSFPDADDAVRFEFSGNWIFRVIDKEESRVFAEGRFFVVDDVALTTVSVTNDYLTANASPDNQIHKLVARVKLPQEIDGYYYTTVDVYQNRRCFHPYRIDTWDANPYTHVEGHNTGERIFTIMNIKPGNEYRVLDLGNVTRYPNASLVKNVEGADQMRLFWRTGSDRNGVAMRNSFTGLYSDYLEVLFRLDLTSNEYRTLTRNGRDIFLVGEFNFWNPGPDEKLTWDENERSYIAKRLLRRGVYDYQYITGKLDTVLQDVVSQDWFAIEGNDWRTTNAYTVLVYYNDPRFGGFDRIVGIGVGTNSPMSGSN